MIGAVEMRRNTSFYIIAIILICQLATISSASERRIASADRISSGDWIYDAMISLSADNLVPGMASRVFQGDRLFNRLEMAELVISILDKSDMNNLTESQQSLINKLVIELKPEIKRSSDTALDSWDSISATTAKPVLTGFAQAILSHNTDGDDSLDIPYHATGIVDIRGNILAAGTIADKNTKFFHELRDSSIPDKLFLKGTDSNFQWTIGKEYMNWSPSYTGSMILSDNSKSFIQLKAVKEIDLGKQLGRIKLTQFGSTFSENGDTFYLFGKRYEKSLSKRLFLGINEVTKTDELPNPLVAIMPYYLYQHLFDVNFNILGSLDLLYQMPSGMQIYTDFMVDDMSASQFFNLGYKDPKRKTGYTIGTYFPKVLRGDKLSTLRIEYLSVDPRTYGPVSGTDDRLQYTHGSMLIGNNIGPNVNALYIRGEHYFTPKLSIIAEYLNQKQKKKEEPFRNSSRTISAQISYDFAADTSASMRIAPTRVRTPDSGSTTNTAYEIRLMKSF